MPRGHRTTQQPAENERWERHGYGGMGSGFRPRAAWRQRTGRSGLGRRTVRTTAGRPLRPSATAAGTVPEPAAVPVPEPASVPLRPAAHAARCRPAQRRLPALCLAVLARRRHPALRAPRRHQAVRAGRRRPDRGPHRGPRPAGPHGPRCRRHGGPGLRLQREPGPLVGRGEGQRRPDARRPAPAADRRALGHPRIHLLRALAPAAAHALPAGALRSRRSAGTCFRSSPWA